MVAIWRSQWNLGFSSDVSNALHILVVGDSWYFWLVSWVCRSLWNENQFVNHINLFIWCEIKYLATKNSCLVTGHTKQLLYNGPVLAYPCDQSGSTPLGLTKSAFSLRPETWKTWHLHRQDKIGNHSQHANNLIIWYSGWTVVTKLANWPQYGSRGQKIFCVLQQMHKNLTIRENLISKVCKPSAFGW